MEEIIETVRKYHKDFEAMAPDQTKEVAEVLDAFLSDYQHEGWDCEAIGYGTD